MQTVHSLRREVRHRNASSGSLMLGGVETPGPAGRSGSETISTAPGQAERRHPEPKRAMVVFSRSGSPALFRHASASSSHARRTSTRGFTLIELMVVIAIVSLAGAMTLVGMRGDGFSGAYRRMVDEFAGTLVQARHQAMDDQARVRFSVFGDRVEVRSWNATTKQWDAVKAVRIAEQDGGALAADVCIYGFQSGVRPPSQAVVEDRPTTCLDAQTEQRIEFQPDGSFSIPDDSVDVLANSGVTMWFGDNRIPGQTRYGMIEVFVGGLVRTFPEVRNP